MVADPKSEYSNNGWEHLPVSDIVRGYLSSKFLNLFKHNYLVIGVD